MNLTFTVPRSRPAHLAAFALPQACESPYLELTSQAGVRFIAERDPDLPIYHARLPAPVAGRELTCAVEELSDARSANGIGFEKKGGSVDVALSDRPFMTFNHGDAYPKPVINPILTPGGVNMLREPMGGYADGEHPWQRGLTLMQGAINGVDCWNEQRGPGFGRTVQDEMAVRHQALSLVILTGNTWYEGDRPLMTDRRWYRLFESQRDAVVLDVSITLKATHGPVTIGATKEGGFLCIRVNPTMDVSGGGHMQNAYGANDETGCWSNPSHWMDYYGPVGDEVAGFAIFDHPSNFRYPTTWHVRGYGLFAPNCWMFKEDHRLAAGAEMTFRWRIVIHQGDTAQADIGNRFLDYVDGPRVVRG